MDPTTQSWMQPNSYSFGVPNTTPGWSVMGQSAVVPQVAPAYMDMSAASQGILSGYGSMSAPATGSIVPTGGAAAAPQGFMQGAKTWLSNGQNLGSVFQGIGALTNAYLGFRQLSMAKDQLNFQKDSWAKNFANSAKTYNTSLEDRIRGRTADYSGKESDVQSYLAKHKLSGG